MRSYRAESSKPTTCAVQADKHANRFARCTDCGVSFCEKHIYIYVDDSNEAITKNSKQKCRACMKAAHWNE